MTLFTNGWFYYKKFILLIIGRLGRLGRRLLESIKVFFIKGIKVFFYKWFNDYNIGIILLILNGLRILQFLSVLILLFSINTFKLETSGRFGRLIL